MLWYRIFISGVRVVQTVGIATSYRLEVTGFDPSVEAQNVPFTIPNQTAP
jgi:hypothetical protein